MNRLLTILTALTLSVTAMADVLGIYSFEGTLGDSTTAAMASVPTSSRSSLC